MENQFLLAGKRVGRKTVLRALEKKDYVILAEFLEEKTFGRHECDYWLDRFTFWWEKNPAWRPDIARGWVLEDENGNIGGFFGNIPVRYVADGRELTVYSGTTWYVDEDLRQGGLALLNRFLKQKCPFLNTTPIEQVYTIFTKLGFKELSRKWLKREGIYPIESKGFWSYCVHKSINNKPAVFFLKIAGVFTVPCISLIWTFRKRFLRYDVGRYTFQEINRFDASFSELFDRFRESRSLLAKRDAETLNWFFFGSKSIREGRRVIALRQQERLIGYAAVKVVVNRLKDRKYYSLELVDLMLLETNRDLFFTLFTAFVQLAETSTRQITFLKVSPLVEGIEDSMTQFGFLWQDGKSKYLYRGFEGLIREEQADKDELFYATPLDGDRCFFP